MENKILSKRDIQNILNEYSDKVKKQMELINLKAALDFYSVDSGTYDATGTFSILGKTPQEKTNGTTLELIYTYSSSELKVNSWESPWGIFYPGNSSYAFDTGFIHGLHGGPRPSGNGHWSWSSVKQSTPIWDLIMIGANSLHL